MVRIILGFPTLCSAICCLAGLASADLWSWGDNWLLDVDWQASGVRIDDNRIPLDIALQYWRTAWRDPSADISSRASAFYQVSATTGLDRYQFTLSGRQGRFSPEAPTASFSGGNRFELDISLGYRLLPTLAAFGGWRIVHYEYDYEEAEAPQGGLRLTAKPTYAGFLGSLLLAVPIGNSIVPFACVSACRLTAEGDYPPLAGALSEWGVAVRPTQLPLSFRVSHRTQRLESRDEVARGTEEKFSGIVFGFSYVFRVEAAATQNRRESWTKTV